MKKSATNSSSIKFFFLIFILFILGLTFICLYSTFLVVIYSETFKNIEISSEYDLANFKHLLPKVKLNFINKNILLEHKIHLIDKQDHVHDNTWHWLSILRAFYRILKTENNVIFESKANSMVRLFQERNGFEFKMTRIDTKQDQVECFNSFVEISEEKRNAQELEVCYDLMDKYFSWFGGHESHDEPFWPINNQTFEYKSYVTG